MVPVSVHRWPAVGMAAAYKSCTGYDSAIDSPSYRTHRTSRRTSIHRSRIIHAFAAATHAPLAPETHPAKSRIFPISHS